MDMYTSLTGLSLHCKTWTKQVSPAVMLFLQEFTRVHKAQAGNLAKLAEAAESLAALSSPTTDDPDAGEDSPSSSSLPSPNADDSEESPSKDASGNAKDEAGDASGISAKRSTSESAWWAAIASALHASAVDQDTLAKKLAPLNQDGGGDSGILRKFEHLQMEQNHLQKQVSLSAHEHVHTSSSVCVFVCVCTSSKYALPLFAPCLWPFVHAVFVAVFAAHIVFAFAGSCTRRAARS